MIRRFFYYGFFGSLLALPGCKALEPIEQNFFLGRFINENEVPVEENRTYPLLIFRTPGYQLYSKRPAVLELDGKFYSLDVGQVEVIDLPAGVHHFKVNPGGADLVTGVFKVRAVK